jgi:hypothetical protein
MNMTMITYLNNEPIDHAGVNSMVRDSSTHTYEHLSGVKEEDERIKE